MSNPSRRVFVVDDEEPIRLSLTMLLRTEGLEVQAFASAAEAIAAFEAERPCCILTDYHMPVMTGPDLIREIHRRDPTVPVIVMTGSNDSARIPLDERVSFVSKPFDAKALAQMLCELAGARRGA